LVLADLAEVGDADGQVGKGAEADDAGKVVAEDARDEVKGVARDALYKQRRGSVVRFDSSSQCESYENSPVSTRDAAEKTPNIVRQPERRVSDRA
jgi:hypothetical protein